jgi:DNA-binding MarR family transcriptional regulator
VQQARAPLVEAYASRRSWRERVRHALAVLLRLLDSEPQLARVLVLEALGAGKLVLARRSEVLRELAAALDREAPKRSSARQVPLLTAEGVVGGAFSVVHARVLEWRPPTEDNHKPTPGSPDGRPLIELHGQLMALIALPYLGARAAGEEITRSTPEAGAREAGSRKTERTGRLLERLEMRLTYRTVRCLMFIDRHPGASNREIAKGADIPDEGQASKLLGRLMNLDLISNSRPPGPGRPNRWTLTAQGEQVLAAVRSH